MIQDVRKNLDRHRNLTDFSPGKPHLSTKFHQNLFTTSGEKIITHTEKDRNTGYIQQQYIISHTIYKSTANHNTNN